MTLGHPHTALDTLLRLASEHTPLVSGPAPGLWGPNTSVWPPRGQARGDARGEPSEAGARRILLAPPRPWTSETDAPGTSLAARAGGFSFLYMSRGLRQQILGCIKLIQSQ